MPTPPAPGVDQCGLTRAGGGRTRRGSRRRCRRAPGRRPPRRSTSPSGIRQAKASGTARSSACEPSRPTVTTRSPTAKPRHLLAHPDDRAGALVADDVGDAGQVAAETVERVAALDADRLHPDQDVPAAGHRIGHVLVAEDVGRPRLVVHRCLHERTYSHPDATCALAYPGYGHVVPRPHRRAARAGLERSTMGEESGSARPGDRGRVGHRGRAGRRTGRRAPRRDVGHRRGPRRHLRRRRAGRRSTRRSR